MASSKSSVTTLPGGFQPVPDVKNKKHVQDLGRFVVALSKDLVFIEVVEAQSQVVAGSNYSLLIKALNSGLHMIRFYKAVVYERPWEDVKTLSSFEPVLP